MKILKGLLITLLALVVIYFILAFVGPKEIYRIEESRTIKAPKKIVWEMISKLENWGSWSPWKEKEPTATYDFKGTPAAVGETMSWDGKEIGKGSMETIEIKDGEELKYHLKFTSPEEMESKGGIVLTEVEEGVEVKWYDYAEAPFVIRPIMLFKNIQEQVEKEVLPEFKRGLHKIDSLTQLKVLESTPKPVEISEQDFIARTYIGIRHKTTMKQAMQSNFYEENFGKLGALFGKNQWQISGMPSCIYFSWNEKDSTTELMPAFPVQGMDKINAEGFELITVSSPINRAVVANKYGPYEQGNEEAYAKLEQYIKDNGLKTDICIEEYANDPAMVKPNEILTKIYFIISDKKE